jgi:hypothetical protein
LAGGDVVWSSPGILGMSSKPVDGDKPVSRVQQKRGGRIEQLLPTRIERFAGQK